MIRQTNEDDDEAVGLAEYIREKILGDGDAESAGVRLARETTSYRGNDIAITMASGRRYVLRVWEES
jgi:hypothetical protein